MDRYVIGVDLGGTNMRCGLVDPERHICARYSASTAREQGADPVLRSIAEGVEHVIAEAKIDKSQIAGVGVGAPGPLDSWKGIVIEAPNLGWRNVPVASILGDMTGLNVYLENDANCAGFGEYWAGAGRGCQTMVLMTLGTGVGGAIILNGHLYRGIDGTAGEFGHVVIIDGGRPAATGNRGALEAYASATATVARFREALSYGWQSSLSNVPPESITCQKIFEAAQEGDSLAIQIVTETGRYLGVMAANLANLLNPERCIFSGGMIQGGDILFNAIREECNRRAFPTPAARMEILPADLGQDAGLIGAAGLALERASETSS